MINNDIDLDTMNLLFDSSLKPLKSKYARTIFNIFLKSKEIEYLTTLDIQKGLSSYRMTLSKKEINAWLKSLHSSSLISKGLERGKPTTIEYNDRYTYDKWSITPEGLLLSKGLHILRNTVEKKQGDIEDTDLENSIMLLIKEHNGALEIDLLKEFILNKQGFNNSIDNLKDMGFITEVTEEVSLFSKFLSSLGLKINTNKMLILTEKGYGE